LGVFFRSADNDSIAAHRRRIDGIASTPASTAKTRALNHSAATLPSRLARFLRYPYLHPTWQGVRGADQDWNRAGRAHVGDAGGRMSGDVRPLFYARLQRHGAGRHAR
jgi:hypothetical protein